MSYGSAHRAVRNARGRASEHPCIDCGAQAEHWSYDHEDPHQIVDDQYRTFSLAIEHYAPRCRPCHGQFDTADQWREIVASLQRRKCPYCSASAGTKCINRVTGELHGNMYVHASRRLAPDEHAPRVNNAGAALLLGVQSLTWRKLVSEKQAPQPDGREEFGKSPWWYESTVIAYRDGRPGMGTRPGHGRRAHERQSVEVA